MSKKLMSFAKKISFLFLSIVALSGCNAPGNDGPAFTIELGKETMNLVLDTSEKLSYDILPDIPDEYEVTWVSSDNSVCTVNESGRVSGLKKGTATITATLSVGGSTDSCVVTVGDPIDYVGNLTFDLNSTTKKAKVTTHLHVDGDTTHFNISPDSGYQRAATTGILKARYLGVDTPESTGQIEEWGKAASKFTKERVTKAKNIYVESEDSNWNEDSNGRALVWVWYQMNEGEPYRNLNVELLQEGFSKAKNTAGTRYGEIGMLALNQAKAMKKHVHSTEKDPDYYYGKYQATSIKGIRTNLDYYLNKKVSFDATIVFVNDQTVYLEDYVPEDDMVYGMQLFLGYTQVTQIKAMTYSNYRIRVAGSLQYYEAGDVYQVADPHYEAFPEEGTFDTFYLYKDANANTDQKATYFTYVANDLKDNRDYVVTRYETDEGTDDIIEKQVNERFTAGDLMCSCSAIFENLQVVSTYTTLTGDHAGAISLTCKDSNGDTFTVRTEVLKENGEVVTADRFENKTIDAKGIIDKYDGAYQLKVFNIADITIHK